MSWMDYLSNAKGHYVKKSMFEILQERYMQNEQIVDRLSVSLLTESDVKQFLKLITDVYELAYMKAVNDHKEQLQNLGLIATIVPQKTDDNPRA